MTILNVVATELGLPPDIVRIATCLLLSFPLCALLKRFPSNATVAKDLMIFLTGLWFLVGIFDLLKETCQLFFAIFLTYFLVTKWSNRWFMPWLNFLLQMAILFVTHCREQFSGGDFVDTIGISGTQMILVIKLTSLGWDIYDGTRPAKELPPALLQSRVTQKPGILRLLSWAFYFPAVLTGPSCGFKEYSDWVEVKLYSGVPAHHMTMGGYPRSLSATWLKLGEGAIWAFLYIQSSKLITPEFYEVPPYVNFSWAARVAYLWALSISYRTRYYAAWCISEAACIQSGLGYNGMTKDGKLKWDRVSNVRALSVEIAQNTHGLIGAWNINTSKWLRHYVYLRVTPKGKKPGSFATTLTFLVSALWHGTRPGYYLTFILAAFLQMFGKIYRKCIRPVVLGTSFKLPYDIISWVVTQTAFAFAVQPFVLLDLIPSMKVWASVYFFVPVGMVVSWVLLVGPASSTVLPLLRELNSNLKEIQ